ncbi:MAG: glycerophosphodiester phosphodiesterase [Gemmatimonadetes bacterium]|nr:glycerophosphodiester phosphodiesterase [Gemmatimonadota bacterium]NNK48706.1 glycerophosphodiester phosphodiesterase [Gemmatimonadota bacterium]
MAPENTVPSIRHGVEVGAQAIEIDLHASKDGTLVVIHDPTLERTTDGAGPVDQRTMAELQTFDAGFRFTPDEGKSFPFRGQGVRIPTLNEAMEAIGDLPAILEVKSAAAGRLLAEWLPGQSGYDRIIVGGFNSDEVGPAGAAARWRCAYQTDLLGFVLWGKLGVRRPLPSDLTAAMVPVRKGAVRIVTRGFVRRMHAQGKGVFVWTVNRPDEMRQLLDLGVDGLISDYPAVLRRVVEERWAAGQE